ncbi:MAG: ComF family protein [Clostridia bacterium]|nr:ComF family protein [Clostridia bacterium]
MKRDSRNRLRIGRVLLGILLPERCPYCNDVVRIGEGVCPKCRTELPRQPEPICGDCGQSKAVCGGRCRAGYADGMTAPYIYRGTVRDAILRFKHSGTGLAAQIFAADMAESVARQWADLTFDAVVFVPMTKRQLRRREYNQSEWLAREVGRRLGVPVWNALLKTTETKPQKSLSAQHRAANVRGTLDVADDFRSRLSGKRLLLVDDLATTGSTVQECALMLKLYGVEAVYAVTLARTWQDDAETEEE